MEKPQCTTKKRKQKPTTRRKRRERKEAEEKSNTTEKTKEDTAMNRTRETGRRGLQTPLNSWVASRRLFSSDLVHSLRSITASLSSVVHLRSFGALSHRASLPHAFSHTDMTVISSSSFVVAIFPLLIISLFALPPFSSISFSVSLFSFLSRHPIPTLSSFAILLSMLFSPRTRLRWPTSTHSRLPHPLASPAACSVSAFLPRSTPTACSSNNNYCCNHSNSSRRRRGSFSLSCSPGTAETALLLLERTD